MMVEIESVESDIWSRLPSDLLCLILNRLSILDRLRCHRLVCKSWQSADIPHHPTKLHPPLLFLPDRQDPNNVGKLFAIAVQKPQRIRLPRSTVGLRFHSSSNGWLAYTDSSFNLHLINPLTSAHHPLPPITTFSAFEQVIVNPGRRIACPLHGYVVFRNFSSVDQFYKKVVVYSLPSSSSMIIFVVYGTADYSLAFARLGDDAWTDVLCPGYASEYFQDIMHHKGQFYAVTYGGHVMTIDINVRPVRVSSYSGAVFHRVTDYNSLSLVESVDGSELMLVRKYTIQLHAIFFEVLKLDLGKNYWVGVERLEGAAIFLGGNESVSISVSDFPELNENCIYFTDVDYLDRDYLTNADYLVFHSNSPLYHTGVYNLKYKTYEPFFHCDLLCGSPTQSLPSWFAPRL